MITALTVGYFGVFVVLSIGLMTWALTHGARWAKISTVSNWRAFLAILSSYILTALLRLSIPDTLAATNDLSIRLAVSAMAIFAMLTIQLVIIGLLLRCRLRRAAQAWLPVLGILVAIQAAHLTGTSRVVFRSFHAGNTNAMAPTVLGRHIRGRCPRCGHDAYATFQPDQYQDIQMMCSHEQRSCRVAKPDRRIHAADRILVNRVIEPKRWDLVVFDYPHHEQHEAQQQYIMRLVGLPGEKVFVDQGAVWIDGKKLSPPDSINNLRFELPDDAAWIGEIWGTRDKPAELADDEYFVLGDFSMRSKDSRFWRYAIDNRDESHPPYAVPASHMFGVVTHVYWPLNRLRAFR